MEGPRRWQGTRRGGRLQTRASSAAPLPPLRCRTSSSGSHHRARMLPPPIPSAADGDADENSEPPGRSDSLAKRGLGWTCLGTGLSGGDRAADGARDRACGSLAAGRGTSQPAAAHAGGGFGSLIECTASGAAAAGRCGSSSIGAAGRSGSDGLSGRSSSGTWWEDHLEALNDPEQSQVYDLERAYHEHLAFQGSPDQPQLRFGAWPPAAAATDKQRSTQQLPEQQRRAAADTAVKQVDESN